VGATTWVQEDKTPNLGPFIKNPGVKQILTNKSVINNRTFSGDNFF
jgi:Na+-transporting NADH:ubiquinone oxidoreductase subunit NqrC